jgi:hypothetical protein
VPETICPACVAQLGQAIWLNDPDELSARTATALAAPALTEASGTVIGRYKLLEKLGEGGFGAVWAAEQREPVRRRVALKIIKLGMDTRQVVAPFEAERQALAPMDHPNIAKVLDAGAIGEPEYTVKVWLDPGACIPSHTWSVVQTELPWFGPSSRRSFSPGSRLGRPRSQADRVVGGGTSRSGRGSRR